MGHQSHPLFSLGMMVESIGSIGSIGSMVSIVSIVSIVSMVSIVSIISISLTVRNVTKCEGGEQKMRVVFG